LCAGWCSLSENRPYVSCTWLHTYAWSCNRVVGSIPFTRSISIKANKIKAFKSFRKAQGSTLLRKLTTIARRFNVVRTVKMEDEFNNQAPLL